MTPDGSTLVYSQMSVEERASLMLHTPGSLPRRFHANAAPTHAGEAYAQVSPDGKWLAYCSTESGTWEVYVERFPESGERVRISSHGGLYPRWASNMRELYYWEGLPMARLLAVSVDAGKAFRAGTPAQLLEQFVGTTWDVAPDGKRFLIEARADPKTPTTQSVVAVTNWFEELRRKAPAKR
jgi:serine/threonine-protein kinase